MTRGLQHGARVLLLGIAFKNKSDDLRESPNVDLARMLITAGYHWRRRLRALRTQVNEQCLSAHSGYRWKPLLSFRAPG